jgi:hypothetical protein
MKRKSLKKKAVKKRIVRYYERKKHYSPKRSKYIAGAVAFELHKEKHRKYRKRR